MRLSARLPFLVVAARLYSTEELGRFAYATMIIELAAHLSTIGLKRFLIGALAHTDNVNRTVSAGMIAGLLGSIIACAVLALFPRLLVPVDLVVPGPIRGVLILIPIIVITDLMLISLLHVHELGAQVWSRSVAEPWMLLIVAATVAVISGADHPLLKSHGLLMGYAAAMIAACGVAVFFFLRYFRFARPDSHEVQILVHNSLPLFASDAIDWAQRRVDVIFLGQIAGARAVAIYFLCQQVATLVQKMRASFEPILLPVTARAIRDHKTDELRQNLAHVQKWLFSTQAIILAILGVMGGPLLTAITGVEAPALTLVLSLLLLAELFWGTFGIVEVPLVYASPKRNLTIGIVALGAEVVVALIVIPVLTEQGIGAVGAAIALCTALGLGAALRSALAWRQFSILPPAKPFLVISFGATCLAVLLWFVKQHLVTFLGNIT